MFPHLNHDVCIVVAFIVLFVYNGIIFWYLEMIYREALRNRPPVEFVRKDEERYCRKCGHEMEPLYKPPTERHYFRKDGMDMYFDYEWVLDYCPECIKEWR